MVENTTLVTLPQMIDLSLNCPELGSHNFSILHTLLHVLLKIAGQSDIAIEFRGGDSDKIQNLIKATKPSPVAAFNTYNIIGVKGSFHEGSHEKMKKLKKPVKKISLQDIKERSRSEVAKEQEIRVIEGRKDSKEDPIPEPPAFNVVMEAPVEKKAVRNTETTQLKSETAQEKRTTETAQEKRTSHSIIVVDSSSQLPQFSVAMTKDHFDVLQQEVETIKKKVKELAELPANMGLIEATRTQSGPIVDMFQILNLTKRMDACEESMHKLATLIEDIARASPGGEEGAAKEIIEKVKEAQVQMQGRKQSGTQAESGLDDLAHRITTLEHTVNDLADFANSGEKKKEVRKIKTVIVKKVVAAKKPAAPKEAAVDLDAPSEEVVEKIVEAADRGEIKEASLKSASVKSADSSYMPKSAIEGVSLPDVPPIQAMRLIQEELENIKIWIQDNARLATIADDVEVIKTQLSGAVETSSVPPEVKFNIIESKFSDAMQQINSLDLNYNNQINTLQEQLMNLQKEVTDILEKINTIMPGGDSKAADAEGTQELYNKLMSLEHEMSTIQNTATQLHDDKEERDRHIEAITEQIDLLKIVKANREDLEDALGDKADACMINRKVSHDQFDAAYDDLSRGIEEALNKLTEQEEMWHQALTAMQKDVGNKLDKVEVTPLRDFVNAKLKSLQEKFKSLTALKREQEAAGTKSKFLRNVTCISCDKDVIMRKEMDPTLRPQPYAMPPNKNIAPYLAYELDQLRKQQKCVPGSKNLNFYENALKSKASKDKNHVCNRYCGGSHTVTTPQQRVTRLGHFLEQWGPEIAPVNDEYVKGKDNQMYKARDDAVLNKLRQETQPLKAKKVSSARESEEAKPTEKKLSSKPATVDDDNAVTKDTETRKASSASGQQPRRPSILSKGSKQKYGSESNIIIDEEAQEILVGAAAHRPVDDEPIEQKAAMEEVKELEIEPAAEPTPEA